MKKALYLLLVVMTFVSCSPRERTYEKTISDYIQTDRNGTKYDLNFKVEQLTIMDPITVADSIAYLTEEFKKDQQLIINRMQLAKDLTETLLANEKKKRYPNQQELNNYTSNLKTIDHRIDSLRNLNPDNLKGYESRKPDEVLAIVARCTYSCDAPIINSRATETFDFFLSPDGTKCYTKKRAKE